MLVGVVGILPLAHTDMNRALGKLSLSTRNFSENLTFLRKRYVSHLFKFKRMGVQGIHRSNIMVITTIIWMVIPCLLFQQDMMARYKYILASLGPGFSWGALLLWTQLLVLISPFAVLTVLAFSIALSNARVIIRVSGPAARAQSITSNIANAQGRFTATLTGIQVCNKAGTITFTAEDQDKPPSKPGSVTCKP